MSNKKDKEHDKKADKKESRYSAIAYWLPILSLYVASLIAVRVVGRAYPVYLWTTLLILSFATGAAVVLGTAWCNAWMLVVVGVSQFAVMELQAYLRDPTRVETLFRVRVPAEIAAVCVAGGIVAELVRKRRLRATILSLDDFIAWLNPFGKPKSASTFDRLEFFQKILTHCLNLWAVWRFVVAHS